jgi:hypothetical protein
MSPTAAWLMLHLRSQRDGARRGGGEAVLICRDVFDRVGAGLRGVDCDCTYCGCRAAVHDRLDAEVEILLSTAMRRLSSFSTASVNSDFVTM